MNGKNKTIAYLDLRKQFLSLKQQMNRALLEEISTGKYILGQSLRAFETRFAKYCGAKFCVGLDSGTSALYLALLAVGVKKGDEIITPANGFIATVIAILQTGAKPVLVDCDRYYLIDAQQTQKAINRRTRAILPVYLYGQIADMRIINQIAKNNQLLVIADACQAHGASQIQQKIGKLADITCFSFYPTKNLGAYGDAGAVVTNNQSTRYQIQLLRNYGSNRKYYHDIIGYNHRLDNLQAKLLDMKLYYLDVWNQKRRQLAELYCQLLNSIKEVVLPPVFPGNTHVYHIFAVKVQQRDNLKKYLEIHGIQTLIHYPLPIHLQKACRSLGYKKSDFPNTESLSLHELSLPIYPELKKTQIRYICETIKNFYHEQ